MTNRSVRWVFNFSKWIPSYQDMLLASSCVQEEEKVRLGRFVFKKDLKSSLIGRLMMRKFVCEFTDQKYNEIRFIRDKKGKPLLLENDLKLNFNVSHQGDYVVFAGECGDILLGIDVMKLEYSGGKCLNDFFRLMTRQFSLNEWETIKTAGTEKEQTYMFCRHWCLKESYVKAIGVGITVNLQDINFKINTKFLRKDVVISDTEIYVKGEKLNWIFQETLVDEEHCVAVAMNTNINQSGVFGELNFKELVKNCIPLLPSDEQYCNDFFRKLDKV